MSSKKSPKNTTSSNKMPIRGQRAVKNKKAAGKKK